MTTAKIKQCAKCEATMPYGGYMVAGEPAICEQCFRRIYKVNRFSYLYMELRRVAETGILPDGDHVNQSTQMWLFDLLMEDES